MTEAGWTREKPTKEGWYWWRFDNTSSVSMVHIMVCSDGSLAEVSNNGHMLLAAGFGGLWLGPITPTDRQQGRVDSLEQKVEELEMEIKRRVWLSHGSRMKHLLYGDDGKMDCNSCGRDYAAMPLEVAQRYELDDAIKLAQQAQGEKGVGEL